ncbi:MAG: hypothetical protein H6826_14340 [Planctomycetes bacterium]|nr:hypothetical protein [Planctomycetota bacterium]
MAEHNNMHLVRQALEASASTRVGFGIAFDSNATRNGYGIAKGLPFALFDSSSYVSFAGGIQGADFTGGLDPMWVVENTGVIKAGDATDQTNSGIEHSDPELNGEAWSNSNGTTIAAGSDNICSSKTSGSDPSWIQDWTNTAFHFHYAYSTGADGDETLQLQVRRGSVKLTGDLHTTTGGAQAYGLMPGDPGDILTVATQRMEVEIANSVGLVAINHHCVEYADRDFGIQTSVISQKSGGTAAEWLALATTDSSFVEDRFRFLIERLGVTRFTLFIGYGGNDWVADHTAPAEAAYQADIEAVIALYDAAWVAAGGTLADLTYCLWGYAPRSASDDFGFRAAQLAVSQGNSRVACYQPTVAYDVADFVANGWYDGGGAEDPHLSNAGYLAVAEDLIAVAEATPDPATPRPVGRQRLVAPPGRFVG